MTYFATFENDEGTVLVRFPDVPGAITYGVDDKDAKVRARDALATALEMYVESRKPLPPVKFTEGHPITLRGLESAKIALHEAMREKRVTKAMLTKRLGLHPPQVDRLLDFRHRSRLDAIEDALEAVGKRLLVDVVAA